MEALESNSRFNPNALFFYKNNFITASKLKFGVKKKLRKLEIWTRKPYEGLDQK